MPRYFCLPIIRFAIFTLAKRKTFGSTWKPGLDADATHGPQRLHAHFAQWKHLPKFKRHESFDPGVPPEICIRGHPTHEGRDMTSTQGCFHSRVPRSRLAVRQQGTGQISYSPSVHGVRKQPPEQNQGNAVSSDTCHCTERPEQRLQEAIIVYKEEGHTHLLMSYARNVSKRADTGNPGCL